RSLVLSINNSSAGAGQGGGSNNLSVMDNKLSLLHEKVDQIVNFQGQVLKKLEDMSHGMGELEKNIENLKTFKGTDGVEEGKDNDTKCSQDAGRLDQAEMFVELLRLVTSVHQDTAKQSAKLDGMEKMLSALDKVIHFVGETFKNSKIVEFILKGIVPWKKESLIESEVSVRSENNLSYYGMKTLLIGAVDDSPSPPAPFNHRIVTAKQVNVGSSYTVHHNELLGGGRFGEVHKCAETATGLTLAAKIVKVKSLKEREEVKNEINVMNQLNHINLIQLYDAFEAKNNVTLIMEYVGGGELFDRIIDEHYNLTELDTIIFVKQICEGVFYLHQQYVLHLDLKPENILCVNNSGNQIKIIDFGLARRYKPKEKLKVNFGTPEFLAPEVVNYDYVSFPTDMWSVGVITYMLLSGLSPFLGEHDTETLNNIISGSWDFDAEAFENVSEEAKEFVSKLLIKEKSARSSAAQCLKHSWLNNLQEKAKNCRVRLKSQVLLQKYIAQRMWRKNFYAIAAANRFRKFHEKTPTSPI
uniref:Protein kinase domain-containing protein n=1 Tax=Callorhinchus milii TaxID=7868 RepID=A0A4W3J6I3_CALMI